MQDNEDETKCWNKMVTFYDQLTFDDLSTGENSLGDPYELSKRSWTPTCDQTSPLLTCGTTLVKVD
jgi:hypothetical protein